MSRRTCKLKDTIGLARVLIFQHSAFSSFPDSTRYAEGSQTHSFRIQEIPCEGHADGSKPKFHSQDGFFYGFAHFVQRKDPLSKRGYDQVSYSFLLRITLDFDSNLEINCRLDCPSLARVLFRACEKTGTNVSRTRWARIGSCLS